MKSSLWMKLSASVLAAVLASTPVPALADCMVHFEEYNTARWVFGAVNTECGWPRYPFGNWGVDSYHGGRVDGTQFQGWESTEGHVEWNSCTGTDVWDFNYPGPSQWSDGAHVFANYYSDPLPWECDIYGDIYSLSDYFTDLYELDDNCGNDCDDYISTLYYPSFDIDMTCADGYCSGWSDWISPSGSPSPATAPIQVFIELIPA